MSRPYYWLIMKECVVPLSCLQGGMDPADVRNARRPSWWDTPKPRQEPALPPKYSHKDLFLSPDLLHHQKQLDCKLAREDGFKRQLSARGFLLHHTTAVNMRQCLAKSNIWNEVDSSTNLLAKRNV